MTTIPSKKACYSTDFTVSLTAQTHSTDCPIVAEADISLSSMTHLCQCSEFRYEFLPTRSCTYQCFPRFFNSVIFSARTAKHSPTLQISVVGENNVATQH